MTAITPTLATSTPTAPVFVGHEPEGRAVIVSVRAGRSVQLEALSGYGKSALLAELAPGLQTLAVTLRVPRAAPFGTFLADLAGELLAVMDYAAAVFPVQPEGARKAMLSRLWQG